MRIAEFIVNNSGGLIKDEKQADTIIVIIVGVLILGSILLAVLSSSGEGTIEGTEYDPSSGYGGRELPDDYK